MSAISGFFQSIGTWFGYVGSCVASPNATCVPFVAFVGLAGAAGAALALVLLAYRSAREREARKIEQRTRIAVSPPAERAQTPAPRPRPAGTSRPPLHATA
jgi:hypothetical protein